MAGCRRVRLVDDPLPITDRLSTFRILNLLLFHRQGHQCVVLGKVDNSRGNGRRLFGRRIPDRNAFHSPGTDRDSVDSLAGHTPDTPSAVCRCPFPGTMFDLLVCSHHPFALQSILVSDTAGSPKSRTPVPAILPGRSDPLETGQSCTRLPAARPGAGSENSRGHARRWPP